MDARNVVIEQILRIDKITHSQTRVLELLRIQTLKSKLSLSKEEFKDLNKRICPQSRLYGKLYE